MLQGLDQVERNLDRWYRDGIMLRVRQAMEQIRVLIEGHAKADHGDTPRKATVVYPGGHVSRPREAGKGWGDVTGNTTQGIEAFFSAVTPTMVQVTLTSHTPYSVFLELARDGKWAWLWPAIEDKLPEIRGILEGITK